MGKAAKFKQLRRLASQLPAIQSGQNMHVLVKGRNVPIQKDKYGLEIDPEKVYGGEKALPVNHYKKMKQNYNKAGMAGAAVYARSVVKHVEQKNSASGGPSSVVGSQCHPEPVEGNTN